MIAILDSDTLDARGIEQAFDRIDAKTRITRFAGDLEQAETIVIPTGRSFPSMIRSDRDLGPGILQAAGEYLHFDAETTK